MIAKKKQCELLKDLIFETQRKTKKWKDLEDLTQYMANFGGNLKHNRRRKKGYTVVFLYYSTKNGPRKPIVIELPNDFAERVLVLGGFP